jgi:DNA-binding transcriptional MerR regulator
MYTISRLAGLFSLSRAALLHYDSIGLLSSSERSPAGYRLYSEADRERLERIMLFRGLGIPLARIKGYLERPDKGVTTILLQRMLSINGEIDTLKDQQKAILEMLEADGSLKGAKSRLHTMTGLGENVGIGKGNYLSIHRVFENASREAHRRFLRHLGFSGKEIGILLKKIRKIP